MATTFSTHPHQRFDINLSVKAGFTKDGGAVDGLSSTSAWPSVGNVEVGRWVQSIGSGREVDGKRVGIAHKSKYD